MLLSDLTRSGNASTAELDQQLRQIASTARMGIKSLDETVWAINPRNDTLPDVIDYLAQFVMESLRAADIRCQLDLPDHPPEMNIPSEVRHSLFLAVKEAVNNVIRHAQASSVSLAIALAGDTMVITIADNGRGFDSTVCQSGQDGLRNINQRHARRRRLMSCLQRGSAGARIRLTLPVAGHSLNGHTVLEDSESNANHCIHR